MATNNDNLPTKRSQGEFLVYTAGDGQIRLEVRLEDETVWLSQRLMAELFSVTVPTINEHLRNIFQEQELPQDSVIRKFRTTAADGKNYSTNHYNLDAIISVGYRVKSHVATQFRIWATRHLTEYIIKGFTLDDERLKNPDQPFDYFEELARRFLDHQRQEYPPPCGKNLSRNGKRTGRKTIRHIS